MVAKKRRERGENARLVKWQERFRRAESEYSPELGRMDRREGLYNGDKAIDALAKPGGDNPASVRNANHVRNVVAELIESQVSSTIPQPKVTARRPQDAARARIIEDMLRNELDRLPFEMMNDMQERTCPIQGGTLFLVEWDATKHGRGTLGELSVSDLHPKMVIPQDGVVSGIEDMDYIFVRMPQTKAYIKRRYGVDVDIEDESDPDARAGASESPAEDLVTQITAYYRNDDGGVGLFTWVNDVELEHLEDYQARRLHICKACGQPGDGIKCSYCDSTRFEVEVREEEPVDYDITLSDGGVIPAFSPAHDDSGFPLFDTEEVPMMGPGGMQVPMMQQVPRMEPTKLPYYKPDIFPVILRKNVSVFGRFLGDSDVDKIVDQQNSLKKLGTKIHEKLLKGGSYLTLPLDVEVPETSDRELKVLRVDNAAQMQQIQVLTLQPNIGQDMAMYQQVYEEARQIIGITDSFQGRRDATAQSGKAKEFAAAQSAGRLESKRVQKEAAYAWLFEAMFKFKLAYADEARPVVSQDNQGNPKYVSFNRYDFLEHDGAGRWRWVDDFLFSCDAASALASNREAMWQETRMNFQQGAYGNPQEPETLILFWTRMEQLSYPGAGDTRTYFEDKLRQQQQMAQMQQQTQQMGAMGPPGGMMPPGAGPGAMEPMLGGGPPMPGAMMMNGGGGGAMSGM